MKRGTLVGGRYRIEEHLASGGMGAVYRARHTLAERSVALKIVRAGLDGLHAADIRRFKREATASATIGHPGIVQMLDAGVEVDDGFLFLVMELLEGESLRTRRHHASRGEVLHWIRALLDPLAAAHAKGFVHRDLKPENVFVARVDGVERVKLLDFGIARSLEGPSQTQTGAGLGTPGYMAPEQALEAKDATPAADVWSVGVMLYETIARHRPFEGETPHATILRAFSDPHPPVEGVSPALAAVIDACLAKRPADRPRDAAALARLLDALPADALELDGPAIGPGASGELDVMDAETLPEEIMIPGKVAQSAAIPRTRPSAPEATPPAMRRDGPAVVARWSEPGGEETPPPSEDATPITAPAEGAALTPLAEVERRPRALPIAAMIVLIGAVIGGAFALGMRPSVAGVPPSMESAPDAGWADDAPQIAAASGVVEVEGRVVRWALGLPPGWARVESAVPTAAASFRAPEPVGAFAPSATLVIEPFDGDTRAYAALGLRNMEAIARVHQQRDAALGPADAVEVVATFHASHPPHRTRTRAGVHEGVGLVLSCHADPERADEVAADCRRLFDSLTARW
ncbi:MAG: protein kinase [Myxococcales bacterium]|nr:protein kinase [Myxococcales bacterium]